MIKRELAKDDRLKGENWDRFLPKYKRKLPSKKVINPTTPLPIDNNTNSAPPTIQKIFREQKPKKDEKKTKNKDKDNYTPFPPPQKPRKEDLLLESGEYFLKAKDKKINKKLKSETASKKISSDKQAKKNQRFIPPKEKSYSSNPSSI